MGASDLRLDQAPPFTVPLRFFLTAPWFALLAAALLAWQGPRGPAPRRAPAPPAPPPPSVPPRLPRHDHAGRADAIAAGAGGLAPRPTETDRRRGAWAAHARHAGAGRRCRGLASG